MGSASLRPCFVFRVKRSRPRAKIPQRARIEPPTFKYGKPSHPVAAFRPYRERVTLNTMAAIVWSILTFPFRVIGWVIEVCGRVVGAILGFILMVLGVALTAGPFVVLGIPLFLVGLILLLKSVG